MFIFLIDWECISNKTLDAPVSPTESTFYLPYPPFGFPLKSCGWFITAPENHIVKVQFSKSLLLLEYSSVIIYDVDGSDLHLADRPSYSTVFSKYRHMYIVFEYDNLDVIKEQIVVGYTAFKPGTKPVLSFCHRLSYTFFTGRQYVYWRCATRIGSARLSHSKGQYKNNAK